MSRLADRLRQMAEGAPRPMGLVPGIVRPRPPSMLTIALLGTATPDAVAAAVAAGADAVVVDGSGVSAGEALRDIKSAAGEALLGGRLEKGGKEDVDRLETAGADMVVLGGGSVHPGALLPEKIDKILEIDPSWDDVLLRGVEQLRVEAVFVPLPTFDAPTILDLLRLQRTLGLARKPAFVVLSPGLGTDLLAIFREAGISGVVVPPAAVGDFHSAIKDLPPPPRRRQERADAMLPVGSLGPRPHEEEEEEEEEEY